MHHGAVAKVKYINRIVPGTKLAIRAFLCYCYSRLSEFLNSPKGSICLVFLRVVSAPVSGSHNSTCLCGFLGPTLDLVNQNLQLIPIQVILLNTKPGTIMLGFWLHISEYVLSWWHSVLWMIWQVLRIYHIPYYQSKQNMLWTKQLRHICLLYYIEPCEIAIIRPFLTYKMAVL